ncbi:MAG: MlaD family protein [Solirubrobacteraceae bacterium]
MLMLLIAVALFAIAVTRWDPFSDQATVQAVFADAIGTTTGGALPEVRLDGVDVGTVSSIARDGGHAIFTLSISRSAARALRANATAALRPRTPFEGTAFVDLSPGTASAPLTTTIPLSHTGDYVGLYTALSFATPSTRAALRSDISGLAATLAPSAQTGLHGTLETLPALVRHLTPAASAHAAPHDDELLGTIRGAARTFAALARSEANIPGFINDSAATFGAFDVNAGHSLSAALRALPATLASLPAGQHALNTILDASDPLAAELRPGLQQLPGTLSAVDPLLLQGQPALSQATPLLANLRVALRTAAGAAPATRTLLADLQSGVGVLNNSLLGALDRQTAIGAPAYLALINALEGGAGAFENFQTPAQGRAPGAIGSGHFVNFQGRFYTGYKTPTTPPCSLFSALSASIGTELEQLGLCTP